MELPDEPDLALRQRRAQREGRLPPAGRGHNLQYNIEKVVQHAQCQATEQWHKCFGTTVLLPTGERGVPTHKYYCAEHAPPLDEAQRRTEQWFANLAPSLLAEDPEYWQHLREGTLEAIVEWYRTHPTSSIG